MCCSLWEAKREAGLVDYGDMIAMAAAMLRSRPGCIEYPGAAYRLSGC